ncbi:P27 family phage terminase small subunit [Solidesulfovibrio carbinoliphilus subsp. oakridgensis]|uniref:P27 family phage terminase small subunit n=1 Tax=Solidesulfovibrio carbinoliphilus subsp. oakridgensis TaxID=694327 RepID=G7QC73_9BACT|nr:P27 family phage terminase small subunit [Solidesulfovibrio carbinoliphilus]EHJ49519.1 P27 family phage terminase small subunit [Solidesulfovibrio carbinoliphilus subsp. oakridgensis]
MGKRGPKPQQALAAVPEVGKRPVERVKPFSGMSPVAKEMWKLVVEDYPADHFKAGDLPLLRRYCEAYARAVEAEQSLAVEGMIVPTATGSTKAHPAIAIGTAADGTMKALAVALRLCANSRMSPKQAGKEEKPVATPSGRSGLMFGGKG